MTGYWGVAKRGYKKRGPTTLDQLQRSPGTHAGATFHGNPNIPRTGLGPQDTVLRGDRLDESDDGGEHLKSSDLRERGRDVN